MKHTLLLAAILIAACTAGTSAEDTPPSDKPNVLFIISDDLNTALSGFGHPQCETPNLDKLASRGMRFIRMYTQYPVCGPSRASIMSGLYPYTNGVLRNGGTLRETLPGTVTMSQLFKQNGYYTARVSKIYHMGVPDDIFNGTDGTDDEQSWDEAFNVRSLEQDTPGKREELSPKTKGKHGINFLRIEAEGGDFSQADGMAANKAIELLRQHKDEPFFLAVGMVRPHVPLVAPAKCFEPYPVDDMKLPIVPNDDLEDVPEAIRGYKSNEFYGITTERAKSILSAYYASIAYMDIQVGRILEALEEEGLADHTIVVFTSDHGYHLGEHHKWQKQHLFEEATRVPFIVSVPWMEDSHGKKTQKITELIDLYPTLADLAGLKAPDYLHGTSLRPLLNDPAPSAWTKDTAFSIARRGGESIRTERWRFTQWGHGKDGFEFYDLTKDPGEFINQANNPDYAGVLGQLKALLEEKRTAAGFLDK